MCTGHTCMDDNLLIDKNVRFQLVLLDIRECALVTLVQMMTCQQIIHEIVWTQIRPDFLSGLIWVQTVCTGHTCRVDNQSIDYIRDFSWYF